MKKVRLGIIGYGNQGKLYAKLISDGKIKNAELSCIASRSIDNCGDESIKCYHTLEELIKSKSCDAVIITLPHLLHYGACVEALKNELHVLCEKP